MAFGTVKVDTITTSTKTVTVDDILVNGTGIISSNMIHDGAIVDADINPSAAIADTKLATISTTGKVSGTAITSGAINTTGDFSTSGDIVTTGTLAVGRSSAASNTDLDVLGTYAGNVVAMASFDNSVDCNSGNYFTRTVSSNTTFTFNSVPASRAYSFLFEIDHNGGTISWPSSVKWPGDTAPTLTTGKTHLFAFITDDGGSRWRGVAAVDFVD